MKYVLYYYIDTKITNTIFWIRNLVIVSQNIYINEINKNRNKKIENFNKLYFFSFYIKLIY